MKCHSIFLLIAAGVAVFSAQLSVKAAPCPTFLTASEVGDYYAGGYYIGHTFNGFFVGPYRDVEYRSFLVFDVPALPQLPVSAALWISGRHLESGDGSETLEIHEVTNSVETLEAYGFTEFEVFQDLGDGALYGYAIVNAVENEQGLIIPLNQEFLSKLALSQGSRLVIGAVVSTPNADETDQEIISGGSLSPGIRLALTFPSSTNSLQILDQPSGIDLVDGQEALLKVEACGADPLSYQWLRDEANIPDATNAVLHFAPAHFSDAGTYTVVVSNSQGTVVSGQALVTVVPLRLDGGYSVQAQEGYDFSLQVSVQSAHPVSFQWYHGDVAIPGSDSSSLHVVKATPLDAGSYHVVATNIAGSATSADFFVFVYTQAPSFAVGPSDQAVAAGATTVLRYIASAAPPAAYYWLFNGAPLNAPNGPELVIVNVNSTDAGIYTLLASNRVGIASNVVTLTVNPAGPLDHWTLRNPQPQPNDLHNVAYANGLFVAVGLNGALVTSTNGQNWRIQQSRTVSELRGVTYGARQFVVVGKDVILASDDGIKWRSVYPGPYSLSAVTYGNGQFVATIREGGPSFLVSSNAVDWRPIDIGYYSLVNGISFGNGRFAAAGMGNGLVVLTSTNGTDWSAQNLGVLNQPEGLRYVGGRFVLVGSDGALFTSNDGEQWIKRNTGITTRLVNVDYGNGAYVVAGVRGVILRSTDLLHWSAVASGTPDRLEGVVFAQDKFLIVGESGTTLMSSTGTTWSNVGSGMHLDLDGITLGDGGSIVAVAKNGTIAVTTNGTDFTFRSAGVTNDLHGITFATWPDLVIGPGGGSRTIKRYVAVGSEGTIITSDDGLSWTPRSSGSTYALKAVAYGQGLFVAVGALGTILSSSDGANWRTEVNRIGVHDLNDVAYGNGTFIVASDAFGSAVSTDGHNWSAKFNGSSVNMRGVGFANNTQALIGNDGRAFFSNGGNWTQHATGLFQDGDNLRGITYGNGIWVIVGNNGIILTSPDTVTWTRRFSPVYVNLHGVRYLNGRFVAIGNAGTILQSDRFAPLIDGARAPGGFLLTIHPGIGDTLRLQKGSTLLNWTNLTTVTNPANPTTYLDTNASNSAGFFRVVSP